MMRKQNQIPVKVMKKYPTIACNREICWIEGSSPLVKVFDVDFDDYDQPGLNLEKYFQLVENALANA